MEMSGEEWFGRHFLRILKKSCIYTVTFHILTKREGREGVYEGRDLARIFIPGCPNLDFKNSGCPKSLIEKVKINPPIMYINK